MPPVRQGKNAFRRPKNMKRTFTRTFSYFRAYRFQLVLVFIGIALSAGANVAGTYMLKPIINDYIVPPDDFDLDRHASSAAPRAFHAHAEASDPLF